MTSDPGRADRESIGELFGRAVDEGKQFASAEVNVVKQTALSKVDAAKGGIAMIVAGALLAYAGLITFLLALFHWLEDALELGPILSGLIVLALAGGIGFLLIKMGAAKMSAGLANKEAADARA